ncbi:MAG: hypothetical protein ACRDIY_14085, partial [Chloroflexota bacterium]
VDVIDRATDPATNCLTGALVRWQHAAGRYWPYVCSAPFVGDPVAIGSPSTSRPSRAIVDAARSVPPGTRAAIFVDLPAWRSLPSTARLNDLGFAVVPVIQRWVTEPAILPSGRLVGDLLRYAAVVRRPRPERGIVFLLDGERAGPPRLAESTTPARAFDNRYGYPACRFPPPALLRDDGVTGVWWLARNGVADDLRDYAATLEAERFSLRELRLAASRPPLVMTNDSSAKLDLHHAGDHARARH